MGIYKKFIKSTDKENKNSNLSNLDLYSSDKSLRRESLSKIDDDDLLLDFALNDPLIEVRIRAVELIDDEDILKDIAYHNPSPRLRVAAIRNNALNNDNVFTDLARDSNKEVRIAAIKRINDADVLHVIASKESNKEVRQAALDKIRK